MIAVICPSYRVAVNYMTVDRNAKMVSTDKGILPDGREFKICWLPGKLRGQTVHEIIEVPISSWATLQDYRKLDELRIMARHNLR